MIRPNWKLVALMAAAGALAACGGSGNSPAANDDGGSGNSPPPPPPPPAPDAQSVSGIWEGTTVTPAPGDVTTGFELERSGTFDIGAAPYTATMTNGAAQVASSAEFVTSGTSSWHIPAGTTATVEFGTNPQSLSFFARAESSSVDALIEILDDNGNLLGSSIPDTSFSELTAATAMNQARIGSVVITNQAGGNVYIDDLAFGYVDEEGTIDCVIAESAEFACTLRNAAANNLLGGVQGNLSVSNTQDVTGSGRRYAVLGMFLPNSTRGAEAAVSGTVTERELLELTFEASGISTTASMTFDEDYDKGSSLDNIEGTYNSDESEMFGNRLDPYIIDTAGVITGAFTTPGGLNCTMSGQVNVMDPAYNAYDVAITLMDCGVRSGDYTGLGVTRDVDGVNDRFAVRIFMEQRDITGFGGGNK